MRQGALGAKVGYCLCQVTTHITTLPWNMLHDVWTFHTTEEYTLLQNEHSTMYGNIPPDVLDIPQYMGTSHVMYWAFHITEAYPTSWDWTFHAIEGCPAQ